MLLISLAWVTTSFAYPMATPKHYRQGSSNVTDDDSDFDWYTPVAVILKPATQKELKKRFQEDDASRFSSFPQYRHPFSPPLPRESYDPWENDHWSQYQSREDEDDVFRDFYNSYDMPDSVQGRLLSLARMGLVAIPRDEIGAQGESDNPINQDEQSKKNFLNYPIRNIVFSKMLIKILL